MTQQPLDPSSYTVPGQMLESCTTAAFTLTFYPNIESFSTLTKGAYTMKSRRSKAYKEWSRTFQHRKCSMSWRVMATEGLALEVPLHLSYACRHNLVMVVCRSQRAAQQHHGTTGQQPLTQGTAWQLASPVWTHSVNAPILVTMFLFALTPTVLYTAGVVCIKLHSQV